MKKELKKSLTTLAGDVLKIAYDANEDKIKSRLSDAQFRKVRKLANNPELFVKDVVNKRKSQLRKHLPIKYDGNFNYTIVSAVYNVEKYLDEYFDSIVNQSLNFKKHIHIILVDDGSTDNSAEIIKKWQKKYPKNIHYYYKENGGQASARNLGLQYVETEWVTFIDPDDFVNADYFKNVDATVSKHNDLDMVVANIQFYIETLKIVRDNHPLAYRFKQKEVLFDALNLGNNMNLSAAASFFKADKLQKYKIDFNEKVKPNFEDGKLIADYLLLCGGKVYFDKDVIYFYRKREDATSTIDTSWTKLEKFSNVLKYGFIPMLDQYKSSLGYVPKHIQRTALYDMAWYVKYLMNKPEKVGFLSEEQKVDFQYYIEQIFKYIDANEILNFNLAGMWFLQKAGMLETFKKEPIQSQIAYIENVDREKKQLLLSYFTGIERTASVKLDGIDVVPAYYKNTVHTFNERPFVIEKRIWVQFSDEKSLLTLEVGGVNARLSLKGKHHKSVAIKDVLSAFAYSDKYSSDGSWLLMDRDVQADDNAEHLYRYLMKNHPEQKCYFALNADSKDWDRLANEGFHLVEFGTFEFEKVLRNCSKIISSHLDRYVNNYFGDEYEYSKKFVFLQHGVTQNNLSDWFNMKKNLQCVIAVTPQEYHSIADDNNGYRLTEKEVVLTGFPRHDKLLQNNDENSKTIIIMPTWRRSILGDVVGDGNTRALNDGFMQTDYARHWYSLLHSDVLKSLVEKYDYQVIFAPHTNIAPYLHLFAVPSYIQIWDNKKAENSMQSLFQNTKLMITDYSSVAFEVAYLNKTVLYYQFDRDVMYSQGTHIVQKGYFDYFEHGFGAVSDTEEELLYALAEVLENDGKPIEPYATRIRETFPFRDRKCCERVYQAIKALDEPSNNAVNIELLRQMMNEAHQHEDWKLLTSRAKLLLENEPDNKQAQALLVEALTQSAQWGVASELIEQYDLPESSEFTFLSAMAHFDWQKAVEKYLQITPSFEQSYQYLQALTKLGHTEQAVKFADKLAKGELSPTEQTVIRLMQADLAGDDAAVVAMAELIDEFEMAELATYKPQLILSKAYRNLGEYDLAHQELVNFEKHTRDDADCRLAIAELAFVREHYAKSISQFEKLVERGYPFSQTQHYEYLAAVYHHKDFVKFIELYDKTNSDNEQLKTWYVKALVETNQWDAVLTFINQHDFSSNTDLKYEHTLAFYRMGLIEEAYQVITKPVLADSYAYWELVAELALLMGDRELERYCYRGMIAIYPTRSKQVNMDKFLSLQ